MNPTRHAGALLGLIAVVAVALQGAWGIAAFVAAGVVGLTIADGLAARRRRPEVARPGVPTLARGTGVRFHIGVTGEGQGSLRLRQPVPPELSLAPQESRGELEGVLVGRHRGVHAIPSTTIRAGGPLGLASCDRDVGAPIDVVVMPDLPRARRMAESRARGRLAEVGRIRSRLGIGTEFETIRDYTPDDDVRQINWTATRAHRTSHEQPVPNRREPRPRVPRRHREAHGCPPRNGDPHGHRSGRSFGAGRCRRSCG